MTIHGLDGRPATWILSRDGSGPATRLLEVSPGWGTSRSGSFSGDVEVFVLSGQVEADGHLLGADTLWGARAGTLVKGLGSTEGATLLLFSGAPLRFGADEGSEDPDRPEPVVAGEREWIQMPNAPPNSRQRIWRRLSGVGDSGRPPRWICISTAGIWIRIPLKCLCWMESGGRHPTAGMAWRSPSFPRTDISIDPLVCGMVESRPAHHTVAMLLIRASAQPSQQASAPGEYPAHLR